MFLLAEGGTGHILDVPSREAGGKGGGGGLITLGPWFTHDFFCPWAWGVFFLPHGILSDMSTRRRLTCLDHRFGRRLTVRIYT